MYVEYDSNNSGGRWWLTDENWHALEAAGWKVKWNTVGVVYDDGKAVKDHDGTPLLRPIDELPKDDWQRNFNRGERFLGALASRAYKAGSDLRAIVDEWERVTGACSTDAGCPCCGKPHSFTLYGDNGEYIKSGPELSYSASW